MAETQLPFVIQPPALDDASIQERARVIRRSTIPRLWGRRGRRGRGRARAVPHAQMVSEAEPPREESRRVSRVDDDVERIPLDRPCARARA